MTPEIDELEDLLDQLIINAQEVIASGDSFPEALQERLSQEILYLNSRIEELYIEAERQQESQEMDSSSFEDELPIDSQTLQSPITDNIRLVWILAGGREDVFQQYLASFPDPEFAQILQNPERLESIINQLHENEPISGQIRGQSADGIPKSELNSSNVYGVKYDFRKNKLLVRFNKGSVYSYSVPPEFYNLVAGGQASATTNDKKKPMRFWIGKNPSLGAAVWQYLRNTGVSYQKIK